MQSRKFRQNSSRGQEAMHNDYWAWMCVFRAPNTCNAKHSALKKSQSGPRSLKQQVVVSHTTLDKCARTRVKHIESLKNFTDRQLDQVLNTVEGLVWCR